MCGGGGGLFSKSIGALIATDTNVSAYLRNASGATAGAGCKGYGA